MDTTTDVLDLDAETGELVPAHQILVNYGNNLMTDTTTDVLDLDAETGELVPAHQILVNYDTVEMKTTLLFLVEKMSDALDTFLMCIPWDDSWKVMLLTQLPSLENALMKFMNSFTEQFLLDQLIIYDIDILCSLLCLRQKFAESLKKITTEWWFHQEQTYHILGWLKNFKELFQSDNVFYDMGFCESKAKWMAQRLPISNWILQTPYYWVKSHIISTYSNHPLLAVSKDFPYEPVFQPATYPYPSQNTVFDTRVDLLSPRQEGTAIIKVINAISSCCQATQNVIDSFLSQHALSDQDFFYHGTNHKSAVNIIQCGLQPTAGRSSQDFSSRDGVYFSESFLDAKEWASQRFAKPAVMIFQVPIVMLFESVNNGRDLTPETQENHQEWVQTVNFCRNKYRKKQEEPANFRSYNFIRGAMCRNPHQVRRNLAPIKSRRMQLCIRNIDYASHFGSLNNLLVVVFYKNIY
ncbi:uncharacterized protein LOC131944315 isoform X2 [Physella acuta]|uniref:uncharacterized protein LOC131944315 isoform X2 n=1 Tax=Physella acuta TaxID=109671 RepID=UPI0027DB977E|nr:uncharacterized protein LOC131944315 isoform X2 [Physella acuta]